MNYADAPTVRWAILKRLDTERGIKVHDIQIKRGDGFIGVGMILIVDGHITLRSVFHLPPQYELGQVHNEIDEIAEQCKEARRLWWRSGRQAMIDVRELPGTGLRGRWAQHGAA